MEMQLNISSAKLNQVGSEIHDQKLNQLDSEMGFPLILAAMLLAQLNTL